MSVLVPEFMSSEDSDMSKLVQSSNIRSNGDQPRQMCFSRRWMLWSIKETMERYLSGSYSNHSLPTGKYLSWAINQEKWGVSSNSNQRANLIIRTYPLVTKVWTQYWDIDMISIVMFEPEVLAIDKWYHCLNKVSWTTIVLSLFGIKL